jgi:hypothetical protein
MVSLLMDALPATSIKLYFERIEAVPLIQRPLFPLVLLFASFLAAALACQRFFYALSFTGLQIERVTFYFLDYVLGLYLPLEPAKCVFKRLTFLKSNFSQRDCTPLLVLAGLVSYVKPTPSQSSGMCRNLPRLQKFSRIDI